MKPSTFTLGLVLIALSASGGACGKTGGGPVCTAATGLDSVELVIAGPDGTLVGTAASAAVTVATVDRCTAVDCPAAVGGTVILPASTRIRLAAASGSEWTLYLLDTAMPADFIKVGDAFDMSIDAKPDTTFYATTDQTVVLARQGNVLLFAASLARFGSPPLPNLLPFGIAVTDAGTVCQSPSPECDRRSHALRVSIATGASVVVAGGQTDQIGGLTVTNGRTSETVDTGGCDIKSTTTVAGFRLAGTTGTVGAGGAAGSGGTTGGAGTAGAGGTTGGSAAAGGDGACVAPAGPDIVEVRLVGTDGKLVTSAVNDSVTVSSIGACGAPCEERAPCPIDDPVAYCPEVSPATTGFALVGSGQQRWTLYLRATAMPNDFIKVGDRFDLVADAALDTTLFVAVNQTVTLSRDGKLLVFAANRRKHFAPPVPDLQAFGITIADGRTVCILQNGCFPHLHDALVTIGNESVFIGNGQSADVGAFRFTNGAFTDFSTGGCGDPPKSQALMAAFRVR